MEGNLGIPILKPHLSPRLALPKIDFPRADPMEFLRKATKRLRPRGFTHEMVMIGKDSPGLESPAVSFGEIEKQIGQVRE